MSNPAFPPLLLDVPSGLTSPIYDGPHAIIWWQGLAERVLLRHYMPNFPDPGSFERVPGGDRWFLRLTLEPRARIEYLLGVERDGHMVEIQDPGNPLRATNPFGENSVAYGPGYKRPPWTVPAPDRPQGRISSVRVASSLWRRRVHHRLYLPPGHQAGRRYPVLVIHDGSDYLRFAALAAVFDNLINDGVVRPLVAVLTDPVVRHRDYGADPIHARHLVKELLPHLSRRQVISEDPAEAGIMGASLGAVASLHAAWRYPGRFSRLLLQSGSFADRLSSLYPADGPIVSFVQNFFRRPNLAGATVYVSCGRYEGLIDRNRRLAPILSASGNDLRYDEAPDGHHWEAWRDRLRNGLTHLFPGPKATE